METQDTRDIVIETRAYLRNLTTTMQNFIEETKNYRERQDTRHDDFRGIVEKKFEKYDAIINRGVGAVWFGRAIWAVIVLGVYWVIDHLTTLFGSTPPSHH